MQVIPLENQESVMSIGRKGGINMAQPHPCQAQREARRQGRCPLRDKAISQLAWDERAQEVTREGE